VPIVFVYTKMSINYDLTLHSVVLPAGNTTQNNKTEITYNSTTIELLYY